MGVEREREKGAVRGGRGGRGGGGGIPFQSCTRSKLVKSSFFQVRNGNETRGGGEVRV